MPPPASYSSSRSSPLPNYSPTTHCVSASVPKQHSAEWSVVSPKTPRPTQKRPSTAKFQLVTILSIRIFSPLSMSSEPGVTRKHCMLCMTGSLGYCSKTCCGTSLKVLLRRKS
eukprot:PhF_6_TR12322/c0_g1_i1/m.19571